MCLQRQRCAGVRVLTNWWALSLAAMSSSGSGANSPSGTPGGKVWRKAMGSTVYPMRRLAEQSPSGGGWRSLCLRQTKHWQADGRERTVRWWDAPHRYGSVRYRCVPLAPPQGASFFPLPRGPLLASQTQETNTSPLSGCNISNHIQPLPYLISPCPLQPAKE